MNKPLPIKRTKLSELDRIEIFTYIAVDNEQAARDLLREFDRKLEFLSFMPRAGRTRPELGPKLRSLPVGNYIMIYVYEPTHVELIRVLHGARDIRSIFKDT